MLHVLFWSSVHFFFIVWLDRNSGRSDICCCVLEVFRRAIDLLPQGCVSAGPVSALGVWWLWQSCRKYSPSLVMYCNGAPKNLRCRILWTYGAWALDVQSSVTSWSLGSSLELVVTAPAVEVWVLVHHFQSRRLNENGCRASDIRLYSRWSLALCTHREASFSISHFRVQHELCLGSTNPAVPVSAVQTQQFLFRQYKPSSSCLGSTNPAVLLLHTMGQFHAPSFFISGAVWDFLAITRDALHLL